MADMRINIIEKGLVFETKIVWKRVDGKIEKKVCRTGKKSKDRIEEMDNLNEYGMTPGPATPVSQQPRVNAQQKKTSNMMMQQQQQNSVASKKMNKQFDNVVKTKSANLEKEQMIKDQNGNDMGMVVSKVGEQPYPEGIVMKNADGELVLVEPDDEVFVGESTAIFNKFDKMSLQEQLRVMDTVSIEKLDEALEYKKKQFEESALPDNTRMKILSRLLSSKFRADDLKKQMEAYWAIPAPPMLKDFQHARAFKGPDVCVRAILKDYVRAKLSKGEITQLNRFLS